MKAIITVGVSGSGKTTWTKKFLREKQAEKETWININRDDIRAYLFEQVHKNVPFQWHLWDWKRENEVNDIVNLSITEAATDKINIVISDTNVSANRRNQLIRKLTSLGYEVEIKNFLNISLDVCVKNDLKRNESVGRDVIQQQWLNALGDSSILPFKRYVPPSNSSHKPTILVDVDGTLMTMVNRKPFDWDKVYNDEPRELIVDIVRGLAGKYNIVIVSGRDGCCRNETIRSLDEKAGLCGVYTALFMREAGDMRRDSIVKQEIFWNSIIPAFPNVVGVIDDRKQVLEMWTDLGIPTINVGNIYERF